MKCIESPNRYCPDIGEKSLFLAGGITGCPDWQQEILQKLSSTDLVIFNPRRRRFPMHDPSAAKAQIKWEADHLRLTDQILFWYPCETLCPIALYELGAWSMSDKPLFVGTHPDYQRRLDIEIQTKIVRPDINIVYSLLDLAEQIISVNSYQKRYGDTGQ
jgi:hypothetical protein